MAQPTKDQLIAAVRGLNPTASVRFLARFSTVQLAEYLEHLQQTGERGTRMTGWVESHLGGTGRRRKPRAA